MAASMTTVKSIEVPGTLFEPYTIPKTELADLIDAFAQYHVIANRRSNQIISFVTHPNCNYELETHKAISSQLTRIKAIAENHISFDRWLKKSLKSFSADQYGQSTFLVAQLELHLKGAKEFNETSSDFLNKLALNDVLTDAASASNTDNVADTLNTEFQDCLSAVQRREEKHYKLTYLIQTLLAPIELG